MSAMAQPSSHSCFVVLGLCENRLLSADFAESQVALKVVERVDGRQVGTEQIVQKLLRQELARTSPREVRPGQRVILVVLHLARVSSSPSRVPCLDGFASAVRQNQWLIKKLASDEARSRIRCTTFTQNLPLARLHTPVCWKLVAQLVEQLLHFLPSLALS